MTERTRYPKEVSTPVTVSWVWLIDIGPRVSRLLSQTAEFTMLSNRAGEEGGRSLCIAQSTRKNATNICSIVHDGPLRKGLHAPQARNTRYRIVLSSSLRQSAKRPLVFWFIRACADQRPGPRSESGAGTSSCRRRRLATSGKLTVRRPPHPC